MFATLVNKAIMNKIGSTNCLKFVKGNGRAHFPTFFLLKQSHSWGSETQIIFWNHWFDPIFTFLIMKKMKRSFFFCHIFCQPTSVKSDGKRIYLLNFYKLTKVEGRLACLYPSRENNYCRGWRTLCYHSKKKKKKIDQNS